MENLLQLILQMWKERKQSDRARVQVQIKEKQLQEAIVPVASAENLMVSGQENNIPILPLTPHSVLLKFLEENQTLVFKVFYSKLERAIGETTTKEIVLFRLAPNGFVKLKYENYESVLNEMIAHFKKVEEYEMIPKCQQLLTKLYINRVIEEAR